MNCGTRYVYDCYGRPKLVPVSFYDPNRLVPYNAMFGQSPADPVATSEPAPHTAPPPAVTPVSSEETLLGAIKKITPTLLVVGIATGAAFAIGGGLVSKFVFRR